MKINTYFYGCSCGCTPSEDASFEGEEPDIYRAIALWALDFITYGDNPCRKLKVPEQSKAILLESKKYSDQISALDKRKKDLEFKSSSYTKSAAVLGIEIPQDKRQEIETDTQVILDLEQQRNKILEQKKALFAYNPDRVRCIEEDEGEDLV